MYSSEDLERFYFQYQTEAMPKGTSIEQFCLKNKVPYNLFYKWYRDTRKQIVEVQVDDKRSYSLFEKKFVAGHQFMKVEREGGEKVYRIDWKDVVLLLENPIVKTIKIR